MNDLGGLNTFALVQYGLVAILFLALILKTKDLSPLAIIGLVFAGNFILPISQGITLAVATILLSSRMKPLYLLGLTATMLLPNETKPFAYLFLIILSLEEYLAEPLEFGHRQFMLSVTFLFFIKELTGGQGLSIIGEYIAILYTLRLIFWATNLQSSLKLVSIYLALIVLMSGNSALELSVLICFQALVLFQIFFANSLPGINELRSLFYLNPKLFFLGVSTILFGPILLMSSLISAYPRFIITVVVSLIALVETTYLHFALGLVCTSESSESNENVTRKQAISYLLLLVIGPLGLALVKFSSVSIKLTESFLIEAICLTLVGVVYGSLKLWLKDTGRIANIVLNYSEILKRGQIAIVFNSCETSKIINDKMAENLTYESVVQLARKSYFPYIILLFLIMIISIMLLLQELNS